MMFSLRKPLTLEERDYVRESLAFGGSYRFGSDKRFIEVVFICDGTSDIVRVARSDGARAEGTIEHANEAAVVGVLEHVKALALAWSEGGSN